jgi:hypothetical protein
MQDLSQLVIGLLLLALAYRHAQVTFDIPPQRGELLALIAIMLWTATLWRAALWTWAVAVSPVPDRFLTSCGGIVVGMLLWPHVPMLAVFVATASLVLTLFSLWREAAAILRWLSAAGHLWPSLGLPVLAMGGLALGGVWIWPALVAVALAAVLMAVRLGRILYLAGKA